MNQVPARYEPEGKAVLQNPLEGYLAASRSFRAGSFLSNGGVRVKKAAQKKGHSEHQIRAFWSGIPKNLVIDRRRGHTRANYLQELANHGRPAQQ